MHKFIVLILKHLIIRRRDYVKTFFELIFPIFIIIPLCLMQSNIAGSTIDDLSHFQSESTSDEYKYEDLHFKKIFYAPKNSVFYQRLMDQVVMKLRSQSSDIIGYLDEDELIKEQGNKMENDFDYWAVIFENSNTNEPTHLNYSIRNSARYKTYNIKSHSFPAEPHSQYGDLYEYFTTIQMAIDTSFIELKSGQNLVKEIWTQPFPYQPYLKDQFVSIKYDILLPFFIINCFTISIIFIIGRLLSEKSTGIRELMKMMGTDSKYLWLAHYVDCLFLQLFTITIIVMLCKIGLNPLIPNTNVIILWLVLFVYVNYIIMFSFTLSTLFSDTTLATATMMIIWIFSQIFFEINMRSVNESFLLYLLSLIPTVPMVWLFNIIGAFEIQQIGVQFSNIFQTNTNSPQINFGVILLYLFINTLLLIPIIWYVDQVNPGFYGLPKPYNFIFTKSYWTSIKTTPEVISAEEESQESLLIEDVSPDSTIGIQINNVTKVFPLSGGYKRVALDKVSLNIYKGGITVLLGHNGAGKTTLMSIITGIFPSTSGEVIINGLNIKNNIEKIRQHIGLCPQHNMTFVNMTVREHIIFFSMLQNHDFKSANKNCEKILNELQLQDKKDEFNRNLSGGQQRRLQLAIALAGNAPVLILDEPTTGLDPENRRNLWDILLGLRKNHTILLTTHFMEEADALGDRIAIIDHGQLKCYGTSMYLKMNICPGYKLNVLKKPNVEKTDILFEYKNADLMIDLRFEKDNISEYVIRPKSSNNLVNFLKIIDEKKDDLGIESYELLSFAMEDVFLTTCGYKEKNKISLPNSIYPGTNNKKIDGMAQFKALIMKKYIYLISTLKIIIPQISLATFLIISSIFYKLAADESPINKPINLNPSLFGSKLDVFYSYHDSVVYPEKLMSSDIINWKHSENITSELIIESKKNISQYQNNLLVAFSFYNNKIEGHYSISTYHTLPIMMNMITNLIAAQELNINSGDMPYITTYNNPIEKDLKRKLFENIVRPDAPSILWASLTGLGWGILLNLFITLPIKEKIGGARELQLLCGVSPYCYWFIFLLFDFVFCYIFTFTIFLLPLDPYETFRSEIYGPMFGIVSCYILGALVFIYLTSFYFKTPISGFIFMMTLTLLDCFISLISYGQIVLGNKNTAMNGIKFILSFIPNFNFDLALLKISYIARKRMMCKVIHEHEHSNSTEDIDYCCDKDKDTDLCLGLPNYFTDAVYGINTELLWIIFTSIFYMIIILLIEYKIFEKQLESSCIKINTEDRIDAEITGVQCVNPANNLLIVKNVHKVFSVGFKKQTTVVNSLNFSLKKGDCFGLIGVNGAGKSTTFKMLAGSLIASKGNILLNDMDIEKRRKDYLNMLSYCPQFDAIGDYMSSRQALTLFSKLRNVPNELISEEVDNILKLTGLEEYANIPSSQYSGGNKRKLSLAVSIIGLNHTKNSENMMILLDEPTSGVDPGSRKLIQNIIQSVNRSKKTIILSSHSLSECESLCNLIGILVKGKIERMDKTQKVKKDIDAGYSLKIKLKITPVLHDSEETDGATSSREFSDGIKMTGKKLLLESLKENINEKFISCKLVDEHETILQYRISNKNLNYGSTLSKMMEIREKFPDLIDDYSITDPTLEDSFLAYISSLNENSE